MPRAGRVSHATLVPLGQPEKAMGHESPIEPWLAPDNRAACGLRTDWLRRAEAMKTAGKEDQKRCLHEAASRDHGTEGSNNPAQTRWAGRQEKIRPRERCFLLDSFYRTNQAVGAPKPFAVFNRTTTCRALIYSGSRCYRPIKWRYVLPISIGISSQLRSRKLAFGLTDEPHTFNSSDDTV